jgi:fructose-bisphosphate aldolase/6-deoxy-5-ketofructose 1-phosphate synthase
MAKATVKSNVLVPADVPASMKAEYTKNYTTMTNGKGRLMLFAGDQKVEHLNDDFYGKDTHIDDSDPEHLFRIASRANIGCFAAQLGLIARYGPSYPKVPYLVKLNSKSPLVKTAQDDPLSKAWFDVEDIVEFKKMSKLNIVGIGYTVYVGSQYETKMFKEAAKITYEAHKQGLIAVFWMYPRGKAVVDDKDPHLIAGAAGVGACLGADFVKVNYPKKDGVSSGDLLKEAVKAAGRTKVVCAGGSSMDAATFLNTLYEQVHVGGAVGNATGRNIHQRPLDEAIRLTNAIYAITVENATVDQALRIYTKK